MRERAYVLGVTGGVGAGKSTILHYLKTDYAAGVIECDAVGRALQQPGGSCFLPLVELLAPYGCVQGGTLDRSKMARVLFNNPDLLQKVNAIVHPAVHAQVLKILHEIEQRVSLLCIESALLLQAGYGEICDGVWYIYTDEALRRERLRISRGYTAEKTDRILRAQPSDEWFRGRADFVIDNSLPDVHNTYEQIDRKLFCLGIGKNPGKEKETWNIAASPAEAAGIAPSLAQIKHRS